TRIVRRPCGRALDGRKHGGKAVNSSIPATSTRVRAGNRSLEGGTIPCPHGPLAQTRSQILHGALPAIIHCHPPFILRRDEVGSVPGCFGQTFGECDTRLASF